MSLDYIYGTVAVKQPQEKPLMANVKLHRVGNNTGEAERSSSIHFHGLNYPVHFDKNGYALVDEDDWIDWMATDAPQHGITLVPQEPKKPAKKAAAKKAPVKK